VCGPDVYLKLVRKKLNVNQDLRLHHPFHILECTFVKQTRMQMPLSALEPLIAKLSQSSPKPVAIFDCDGTIIKGDIGESMLYDQIEQFNFRTSPADIWLDHPEREEIDRLFRTLERVTPEERKTHPLFAPFTNMILSWYYDQLGEMKISKGCSDIVSLFAGFPREEVKRLSEETFRGQLEGPMGKRKLGKFTLPDGARYIKESVELLDTLQHKGFQIWAVSGSSKWSVEPVFARFGIPDNRVIGIDLEEEDGLLLARPKTPIPISHGKVDFLRKFLSSPPEICVSDSPLDIPLLLFAKSLRALVHSRDRSTEEFFAQGNIPRDPSWHVIEEPTILDSSEPDRKAANG